MNIDEPPLDEVEGTNRSHQRENRNNRTIKSVHKIFKKKINIESLRVYTQCHQPSRLSSSFPFLDKHSWYGVITVQPSERYWSLSSPKTTSALFTSPPKNAAFIICFYFHRGDISEELSRQCDNRMNAENVLTCIQSSNTPSGRIFDWMFLNNDIKPTLSYPTEGLGRSLSHLPGGTRSFITDDL